MSLIAGDEYKKSRDTEKKLVLRGVDIYFRVHQGDTALSLAAGNGYLDILEYLSSLKKSEFN